ncbi:MAG: ABC transporter ATP-binding protein [Nitrospinota bacterium]
MSKLKIYLRLLSFLTPYRGRAALAVVCMVGVGALSAAPAYLLQHVVDGLIPPREPFLLVVILPLAVVATYLALGAFTYGQTYLMYWVGQRVVMDIRNALYGHLVRLPVRFFTQKTTGELMSRVVYDISLMQKAASSAVRDMGRHSFALLFLMALAFYQNWRLSLAFAMVLPPLTYLVARMGEKVRRITRQTQDKMGDISALVKEAFTGIRVVKAFNAEEHEHRRFARANRRFCDTVMRAMRVRALATPLVEVLGGVGAGVVLWVGARQVMAGESTPGQFASFLAALGLLYNPLKSLTRVYQTLQEGVAASETVFGLMDQTAPEPRRSGQREMGPLREGICFREVSFAYEDVPVLQGLNLEVPAGKVVALVGLSGAGKTTLMDLIPRFYDPTSGRIEYDGTDGAGLDVASLRDQVGLVTQRVFLFNGTVFDNIAYARPGAEPAQVEAAARAANAHGFIQALPQGYGSMIGEDGVRLSGGERQRVAIARAILKDPSILLLDEATSALDSESEQLVQEALERLKRGRTTLVVAHRLSTVRNADLIAVLDGGQMVETGTHAELMARGGLYRRLYEIQFAEASV